MKPANHPPPDQGSRNIVVLGAGPAGMACAYELARHGIPSTVIERNDAVGGLCRTLERDGYLFDIGGHRFLSKSEEVNALWKEVLGRDLLRVARKSRILFRGRAFPYPITLWSTLRSLGWRESLRCLASFLWARYGLETDETTFEGWMIKRFGTRLYEYFFKAYTEKVWGIPCRDISSDWAAQRIQSLSLATAVRKAIFGNRNGHPKTLSTEFFYPRLGPGLFYEKLRGITAGRGAQFLLGREVQAIERQGRRLVGVTVQAAGEGPRRIPCDDLLSSLPLPVFLRKLRPEPPAWLLDLAGRLRFRNFVIVYLIFDQENLFEDNWLYVHTPELHVGRIQNYKNWSPSMVPDSGKTSLGMEYFASDGDEIWQRTDGEMIETALAEIEKLGLAARARFLRGYVHRTPHAYPVYGPSYRETLAAVRSFLAPFENLQMLGRAGLFRYNNSDHAILTGLYGARNLLGASYDLWSLDVDGCDA